MSDDSRSTEPRAATTASDATLSESEPAPAPADHTLVRPGDVIERFTLEELSETADEYYRRIPDPSPLMAKPFASIHEAPEMLENLGRLLSGLRLGRTMTVLDFGAGTCWLSRIITELRCRAICVDTSATALAIGRRLFAEHPPLGGTLLEPQFLHFDGRRIALPDASVDRIICFDAFHHVPNQAEVLAELGRVLRPGGIAGFSEPGRNHSCQPQSQYEMRNHRVLENDIDLNGIFTLAQPAGFTALTVKLLNDSEVSLDDYNGVFDSSPPEALRARVWNDTHNTTFNRSIFFLHKGAPGLDSRGHEGLAHLLSTGQTGTPWHRAIRCASRSSCATRDGRAGSTRTAKSTASSGSGRTSSRPTAGSSTSITPAISCPRRSGRERSWRSRSTFRFRPAGRQWSSSTWWPKA